MTDDLRPTPLTSLHREAGARLVGFAGWEMPIQYTGIQAEHRAVRNAAGLFDVSHMGRVTVTGAGSATFLQQLLPYDMQRLKPGRMAYTVLCNDDGGAVDDLAVYCVGADDYRLVINAARTTQDIAWIETQRQRQQADAVQLIDTTRQQGMIAVQGPQAQSLVQDLLDPPLSDLGFFSFLQPQVDGEEILLSRSGYTGEDGFELICPSTAAVSIWSRLVAAGGVPAGLAARDTLRLEAGLCLYGAELDESTTPLEAGLAWTLALDKPVSFPGADALRSQREAGIQRRLVGLRLLARGIPRAEQSILLDGRIVGSITSGTHSPTLNQGIALAYVEAGLAAVGTQLDVDSRGRAVAAEVVALPFVPSRVKRRRRQKVRT